MTNNKLLPTTGSCIVVQNWSANLKNKGIVLMKLFLSSNLPFLKTTILGLLFIVFGVQFHPGVKEHYLLYFVLPAIFCPIAIMIFSKKQILKDI